MRWWARCLKPGCDARGPCVLHNTGSVGGQGATPDGGCVDAATLDVFFLGEALLDGEDEGAIGTEDLDAWPDVLCELGVGACNEVGIAFLVVLARDYHLLRMDAALRTASSQVTGLKDGACWTVV